jgi:hypothetical protein
LQRRLIAADLGRRSRRRRGVTMSKDEELVRKRNENKCVFPGMNSPFDCVCASLKLVNPHPYGTDTVHPYVIAFVAFFVSRRPTTS